MDAKGVVLSIGFGVFIGCIWAIGYTLGDKIGEVLFD